ncbi:glycosyltransferase [candidate division GN15 bacterium]|nr:glycosyltransferase [candidate division GN15 bacterium]
MEEGLPDQGNPDHLRRPRGRQLQDVQKDRPRGDLDGLAAAPQEHVREVQLSRTVPPSTDTVSIILVTHNSRPILDDCVRALQASTVDLSTELIVIDNASDTSPEQAIREVFPEATVTVNTRNAGFAAGCNQGARQAIGDYLLFVNPDVIVDRDAIVELLRVCRKRENPGLTGGRLRFPDGGFQATCRNFPTAGNLLFSRGSFLSRLSGSADTAGNRYTLPDYAETTEVPAVAGTLVVIRRDVFERAGGFDERFFMYMEDTDLSLRLHRAGYRNLFVPSAGGVHDWGRGSRISRVRRAARHHYALWQYFLKHEPNAFSLFLLPLFLLANLLIVSILPAKRRPTV